MKLLKAKSQPQQKEAAPAVSLADKIRATCAEAEAYIEKRVQQIKDSPKGEALPISWLALNTRATTKAGGCHCKCALAYWRKTKMDDDNERPVPRGLLFLLTPEFESERDDLQFEKTVCELYTEGRCVVPRGKWVH
jgi:hypothetical protein